MTNSINVDRPLDALNEARGKKVVIELKGGQTMFVGILRAFDIHINIVLDEAEEMVGGSVKRKLGRVLLRGDSIVMVSPER